MRKCNFIEHKYVFDKSISRSVIKTQNLSGTFLGWGIDFIEFENGGANYTAGIIEMDDGKVKLIRADYVQFLSEETASSTEIK